MRKIVAVLRPFDLKQNIFVYEDGNKINSSNVDTVQVAYEICKLAKEYNIDEINLGGTQKYTQGIGKQILDTSKEHYAMSNLNIKYL